MSKSNHMGGIPNRWLHCPRMSSGLIGGKIMAFKTPLGHEYDNIVPLESQFPPEMLFESCKRKKVDFLFSNSVMFLRLIVLD